MAAEFESKGELFPTNGVVSEHVDAEVVDAELLTPGVDSILLGTERLADLGEGVHVVSKTWSVPSDRIVQEPLFLERGPVRPALGQLIVSRDPNLAMITRGGLATRKEHEV